MHLVDCSPNLSVGWNGDGECSGRNSLMFPAEKLGEAKGEAEKITIGFAGSPCLALTA
jgi:hypothetical protein